MILSVAQLLGLAANAGFVGPDLDTAVAVALAESGGNPTAYNPEKAAGAVQGKGSFGLWQIYITAHPEFAGENLLDPQTNAAAAYSIYAAAGNSFSPWSMFKNGAYEAQLAAVQAADSGNAAVDASAAPADNSGEVGSTSDLLVLGLSGAILLWLAMRTLG